MGTAGQAEVNRASELDVSVCLGLWINIKSLHYVSFIEFNLSFVQGYSSGLRGRVEVPVD